MLHDNWFSLGLLSFIVVSITSALLASTTRFFYHKKSCGQMSHSQLRIKQGNATIEHRLNVFALSLIFNFTSLRIYFTSLLLWIAINLYLVFLG